ncbi:transporter [Paenibacillus chitinolyticus]|uniref:Transporter n=1 Tax=Paenibacillus chitinolyticus TaxID=79263 RepID=A0A410WV24_9BACL|nr:transporter [Paenibacillus chitinolyticus]
MSFLQPPPPPHPPAFVQPNPCLYKLTYVQLWTGEKFWFYPISVTYNEASGYIWTGAFWVRYRFDLRLAYIFDCSPVPTLY